MELTSKPEYWRNFDFVSKTGGLELQQIDRKRFILHTDITYTGPTLGISVSENDEETLRSVRSGVVAPGSLGPTDLASVPAPFRWWASRYGVHTPAALIHDQFIGKPHRPPGRPEKVSEQQIDTYFRTMLKYSDVKFLRRWLMWAAVASRTRLVSGGMKTASMIVWVILALAGVALFVWGLGFSGPDWAVPVAVVAPLVASALWWHQWGAGVIISYFGVPLLLPPALLAVPLLIAFVLVESAVAEMRSAISEEFSARPARPVEAGGDGNG